MTGGRWTRSSTTTSSLVGPSLAMALVAGLALGASPASAQPSELERAEAAYQGIDFEATRVHALEALRGGGLDPEELVRVYQLLGISNSALGDTDAANDYFVRMLGIDPDAQLDGSVNPEMRAPYLEARGFWAARQGRLGIEAGLDRSISAVHIELRDPTGLARRVRVAARLEGAAEFTTVEYQAGAVVNAPLEGASEADRVEYYVEVLDTHGNVMIREGSAFSPHVVGRTPLGGGDVTAPAAAGGTVLDEPVFWIVLTAVLAAGAGVAIGVIVDSRSRIGAQTGVSFGID